MKKVIGYLFLIIISTSPFSMTSFFLFLKDPLPWPDEAIYLDMAKNLLSTGKLATSIFGDAILGMRNAALWYPPFYFYTLSGWINIFGQSLESIRILSFILGLLSLIIFFFITKIIFKNNLLASFGTFLLSFDVNFSRAGRIARMDILTFFLILLSFLFLLLGQKRKKYFYIFSGVFVGLSILTHPLGLVSLIIVITYFLVEKYSWKEKIFNFLHILVPAVFLNIFWFWHIFNNFSLFKIQYGLQLKRKVLEIPYFLGLIQTDFSWWLFFVIYTAVFIMAIGIFFKKRNPFDLFLIISFFLSSIFIILGKEGWYFIYFQPFIVLMLLSPLRNFNQFSKIISQGVLILIGVTLLINIVLLMAFVKPVLSPGNNYHSFTKQIQGYLPQKGHILLSSIPDPYFDLNENKGLKLSEFLTVPVEDKDCKKLLDSSDFIVFNHLDWICHSSTIEYLQKNSKKKVNVEDPNGYSTMVIELKPRGERD